MQPGCYLGQAPPDAVIVNEGANTDYLVQRDLVRAGQTRDFQQLFNRDTADGSAMFSSYTVRLQEVKGTLDNYLGEFKSTMDRFVENSKVAKDAVDAATPDSGGGGGGVPKWGTALLVIASLAGGLAAGAFAMKALQRRRRERDTYKGVRLLRVACPLSMRTRAALPFWRTRILNRTALRRGNGRTWMLTVSACAHNSMHTL